MYVLIHGCDYSWNDWLCCVARMTLQLSRDVIEPSLLGCRPGRVVEIVSCSLETAESINERYLVTSKVSRC